MRRKLMHAAAVVGLLAVAGVLGSTGVLRADDARDKTKHEDRDESRDRERPPQVIRSGFESTDRLLGDVERAETAPLYSAWIVESSRFLNVPAGAFMPDRAFVPGSTNPRNNKVFFDLPVNVGIIKGPDGLITLYDSGWKQLAYIFDWNTSCCWADLTAQLMAIGLNPDHVTRIVLGHGHWDHAGQVSSFPRAVVYIQKEELKQIDFFLDYPTDFNGGHIRAVNTLDPITGAQVGPPAQACARSPVCGYPPQTVQEILGKVLGGKAKIIDGRHEIAPGLVVHPAFRGHTYGSQLLQVNTTRGQLVFGSDTYSSWEGIRDWNVANIQQTDTIQQFLAYEKCYVLTSRTLDGFNNCIAAHEPLSYTSGYPITANWWTIPDGNCSRAAELVLAPPEPTHVPATPDRKPPSECVSVVPPHTISP
jgi:glyoxylase-like metal-dependent hydrolase (beta-lactamase superfamily II)